MSRLNKTPPAQAQPSHTIRTTETREIEARFHYPALPPEILRQYNEVLPDGANRILKMTENEQQNRIKHEGMIISGGHIRALIGQALAGIISLSALALGGFLVFRGQTLEGLGLVIAELGTLVFIFIRAQTSNRDERIEKAEFLGSLQQQIERRESKSSPRT